VVVNARVRRYLGYYLAPVAALGVAIGWAIYDLESRQLPLVGLVLAAFGLVALYFAITEHGKDRRHGHLLATGDRGTARIQALELTARSAKALVYRLDLLVRTAAHGEYEKTIRIPVRFNQVARLELGATLAVRVDHEDREVLAIDWSAPPPVRARPHRRPRRTARRRSPPGC
jgi:hypothetical protein